MHDVGFSYFGGYRRRSNGRRSLLQNNQVTFRILLRKCPEGGAVEFIYDHDDMYVVDSWRECPAAKAA